MSGGDLPAGRLNAAAILLMKSTVVFGLALVLGVTESRLVFLLLGDGKNARQPISSADNNPDHCNCGASNRPWPRHAGTVRAVLLDHQRDQQQQRDDGQVLSQ